MSLQTVHFRTRPEQAATVAERLQGLYSALREAEAWQISHLAILDAGGDSPALMLDLPDGATNPLPSLPIAATFRRWLPNATSDDLTPVVARCDA